MKKIDELLKRVEHFEKLAVYGDRSTFLKSLAQDNASYQPFIGSDAQGDHPGAAGPDYLAPAPKSQLPKIPKDVQEMLSNITVIEGIGMPIQIDGDLGPETQKALDGFRRKFNVPGNFDNTQVFDVIRNTFNRTPGQYGSLVKSKGQTPAPKPAAPQQQLPNLDDAYKAQQEYYRKQSLPPGVKG